MDNKDSKNTSIYTRQANEPARTDKSTGHGVDRPGGVGAAATAKHARPNQAIMMGKGTNVMIEGTGESSVIYVSFHIIKLETQWL